MEWLDAGLSTSFGRPERTRRSRRVAHRTALPSGPPPTRRELGAALIEAAYVFPIFMLMVERS